MDGRLQRLIPGVQALGAMVALTVNEADGRFAYASPRWCTLTGLSADEMLGRPWPEAIAGLDRDRLVAERAFQKASRGLAPAALSGLEMRLEWRPASALVDEIWLASQVTPIIEGDEIIGWMTATFDITERRRGLEELRATSRRLVTLVEHLHVGVALVDVDQTVVVVNQAFAELSGFSSPEELVGRRDGHFQGYSRMTAARVPDFDAYLERRRAVIAARQPVIDEPMVLADGRVLGRTFLPVTVEGAPAGHMWLFRDLTTEIAARQEREALLRSQLEQNQRLKELDAAKSNLVASISHELRTPLTSVQSFTELLLDGLGSDGCDDQRQYLDVIARNTRRLVRSVEDLLVVDRLESRQLTIERQPVDMAVLVSMAVSSIRPLAEQNRLVLSSEVLPGPPFNGDRDRLGQLIDNLLTNAVKFTPAGGHIEVEAWADGAAWHLAVVDDGIGIPADDLPRLFAEFFRASNAQHSAPPGSGLGLAIAKVVAELHGGTIDVSSQPAHGSRFEVTLPLDDAGPAAATPAAAQGRTPTRATGSGGP